MNHPIRRGSLDDVLLTAELARRPLRHSDIAAEHQALVALAAELARKPQSLFQRVVDVGRELCRADTVGLSLIEHEGERPVLRWKAVAGVYAAHVGGSTSREFSPCGMCLDRGAPQLFSSPGRYFTYLNNVSPPIVESLGVPISVGSEAIGTLWCAAHDDRRRFDMEDVRTLHTLAAFAASAHTVVSALRTSQSQGELLEYAHDAILGRTMDGLIRFWNKGAERLYGWTREEALGQVSHFLLRTKFPTSLGDVLRQLRDKDYWAGEILHLSKHDKGIVVESRWVLQRNDKGEPTGILELNTDITAQREAESRMSEMRQELELSELQAVGRAFKLAKLEQQVDALKAQLRASTSQADVPVPAITRLSAQAPAQIVL